MCDCDWRRIAKAEAGWTLRRCSRSGGGSTRLTSKSRDHLSAQREANGARMRRVDVDGTAGAHQQQPSNNKRNIWLPQQTVSGESGRISCFSGHFLIMHLARNQIRKLRAVLSQGQGLMRSGQTIVATILPAEPNGDQPNKLLRMRRAHPSSTPNGCCSCVASSRHFEVPSMSP
jgi:hypothetical protein